MGVRAGYIGRCRFCRPLPCSGMGMCFTVHDIASGQVVNGDYGLLISFIALAVVTPVTAFAGGFWCGE